MAEDETLNTDVVEEDTHPVDNDQDKTVKGDGSDPEAAGFVSVDGLAVPRRHF